MHTETETDRPPEPAFQWKKPWVTSGIFEGDERDKITAWLDGFASDVRASLSSRGLNVESDRLFRMSSYYIWISSDFLVFGLAEPRGLGRLHVDGMGIIPSTAVEDAKRIVRRDTSEELDYVVVFPSPIKDPAASIAAMKEEAELYAERAETRASLEKVYNWEALTHIHAEIRELLSVHPDPSRNVFVMMSFDDTSKQLNAAYESIAATLKAHGLNALRADAGAYSDDLWHNVETYMACSAYGIAVFEDINKREFNPNVSLELGYMMSSRKRCLLLKEKHLPSVPVDVAGKLYRPWDSYEIAETVSEQVANWVKKDLRLLHEAD